MVVLVYNVISDGDVMKFSTKEELYQKLLPVFRVKERLIKITKYSDITKEEIYQYLSVNKWRFGKNLTLAEIVNDIITLDLSEIYLGGRK